MIATIFIALVLIVLAYLAHRYLPEPVGLIAAAVLGLLALYLIVTAVLGATDGRRELDAVVLSPLAYKLLR